MKHLIFENVFMEILINRNKGSGGQFNQIDMRAIRLRKMESNISALKNL